MTDSSGSRAPGWYPDPWDTGDERWFDGAAWTRHTRVPGASEPGPPPPAARAGPPATVPGAPVPVAGPAGTAPGAPSAAPASPEPPGAPGAPALGPPAPPGPPATAAPQPRPGWFADPWGGPGLRWWDGTQWTGHVQHAPSPGRAIVDERVAARWARLALVWAGPAQAAGLVASAFQWTWIADNWDRLTRSSSSSPFLSDGGPQAAGAVAQVASVAVLGAAILFLVWFHRAAASARASGLPARRGPGLATASFVIPIVNLWWPYQSTCDLFPTGHPARRLVLRWWLLWLALDASGLLALGLAFVGPAPLAAAVGIGVVAALVAAVAARAVVAEVLDAHEQIVSARAALA